MRATAGVEVRPCEVNDAATLATLAARLFRVSYGPSHPEPQLSRYIATELSVPRVAVELAAPGTRAWLAASAGGDPLGYVWVREALPPSTVRLAARRPLQLRRIFVDPAWHGRGIAQALLAECLAEATRRQADAVWLAVWQHSARPIAFYRKAGFEVVGTATFALADHLDEDFIMALRLGEAAGGGG